MKKIRISLLILVLFIITSCEKNKKIQEVPQVNKIVDKASDEEKEKLKKEKIEKEIEKAMNNFQPAIEFITEYNFTPIDDYNLQLVSIKSNKQNNIECYYNDKLLCTIPGTDEIQYIDNYCNPHRDGRLFSSSISIIMGSKYYYLIINLKRGILKFYKSLQQEYQQSIPFYSGNSNFFIIENVKIIKQSYYDYNLYKQIGPTFGGYIEIYDYNNNQLVKRFDKKLFYLNAKYSIDYINYEDNEFNITIGNYYDSNEFVDFKLFTDNDNFRYEIYDKYLYSEDE